LHNRYEDSDVEDVVDEEDDSEEEDDEEPEEEEPEGKDYYAGFILLPVSDIPTRQFWREHRLIASRSSSSQEEAQD
jgi:hypothetical protein